MFIIIIKFYYYIIRSTSLEHCRGKTSCPLMKDCTSLVQDLQLLYERYQTSTDLCWT